MKYVVLVINVVIFLAVLIFALNNIGGVDISLLPNYTIHNIPLIIVILIALALGILLAFLLTLPKSFTNKRERNRLRNENRLLSRKVENLKRELSLSQASKSDNKQLAKSDQTTVKTS